MDRFVPLNKKSKKEQKKYHAGKRLSWEINPVTRTVPNGRGYDRKKMKQADIKNSRNFNTERPAVFYIRAVLCFANSVPVTDHAYMNGYH